MAVERVLRGDETPGDFMRQPIPRGLSMPRDRFAALVDGWATVLVQDYLDRHQVGSASDGTVAPLYNAPLSITGGVHDENDEGHTSNDAQTAGESKRRRRHRDFDGPPARPTQARD